MQYTTTEAQRKAMDKYEHSVDSIRVRLPSGYSEAIKTYLKTDDGKKYKNTNNLVRTLLEQQIPGIADIANKIEE